MALNRISSLQRFFMISFPFTHFHFLSGNSYFHIYQLSLFQIIMLIISKYPNLGKFPYNIIMLIKLKTSPSLQFSIYKNYIYKRSWWQWWSRVSTNFAALFQNKTVIPLHLCYNHTNPMRIRPQENLPPPNSKIHNNGNRLETKDRKFKCHLL